MTLQDSIAATEGGPYGISLVGPDPDSVSSRFTLPPNARVLGPDGQDVVPGSGQVGVLACTGALPLGYLDAPELTAAVFREIDGIRYAVPGDAATLEADGTVILLGRGAGVINTGGEKVFAEEVEEVLVEHPGVAEAVVVGVPDDRWGSRVTALVVPETGVELLEQELADHVGRQLAGYKRPRSVFVVGQVERTISGKIDRRRALERAVELEGGR
jgi:fatty-acyl-CoA synthase